MPARLRNIKKAADFFGIGLEKPSRGSHWKLRRAGYRVYPVPAHNGLRTEIDDLYINGLCRHFEIDGKEFRSRL